MPHSPLADRPIPAPAPGRIAIVGPCAAGKSTLATRLRALGYDVRHCLQEHSQLADMWQRISCPEVLIYLDVSRARSLERNANGPSAREWEAQQRRLIHARERCTLYIHTDTLSIQQVYERVQAKLDELGIEH